MCIQSWQSAINSMLRLHLNTGNKKTINCVFQQFFYVWWNGTENKDVFYRCLHPGIPVSSSKALLSMCLADKFPQQCRFPYLLNDPSPWILQAPFNNFAQFLSFCLGDWAAVIHYSDPHQCDHCRYNLEALYWKNCPTHQIWLSFQIACVCYCLEDWW